MFDYHIDFESPGYLLLLVLLPVLWWFSWKSLAALGPTRRVLALLLRTSVLLLVILALAEIQMVRTNDKLTVMYLLDQSLSVPPERREAMVAFVNKAIREHRENEDRVGVIVFGRDAAIEIPPFDDDVQVPGAIESPLDPEYTNLAGAMKLAQASFPEDAAKRIVIVSDGNENLGDAIRQARALAASGIGIDVVPVRYQTQAEVVVERMTIPGDVRRGQPFDLRVVMSNSAKPTAENPGDVAGRLIISRLIGGQPNVLSDERVVLPPGKKVFTLREKIANPAFYQYEARFIPERAEDDGMPQNNRATTFTHVRGEGHILLIEDYEHKGQHERLAEALRSQKLEVTIQPSDQLFSGMGELQPYDAVILANVPREHFTDAHIKLLVSNTQQMGAGLMMVGGPSSFGAGGWTNTEIEKAMPLDFQIKSAKVVPRGALAMLMHASEIARGNYWQKVIAQEAIKALGPRDYCGVVHWGNMSGREEWLWKPGLRPVGPNRDKMLGLMGKMTPGDMPDFNPAMKMADKAFRGLPDAAIKHMIVISDGDPTPPSRKVIRALVAQKVTVSTVAVGAHGPAESRVLSKLASATGGKFYKVNNPKALPKIFQREARRVARPLIKESTVGMVPRVKSHHEMIRGIEGSFPPINGYVMTSKKESQLAEIVLVAPLPPGEANSTLLAGWSHGLGKTVVYTSDAGTRWNQKWTEWENYDKFFGQIVRWSMRPAGGNDNFTVATDYRDGRVRVTVSALDKSDEFLNYLQLAGYVSGPDLDNPPNLKMEQTAPGRYEGSFPAGDSGSYHVAISTGAGRAPISTGVNIPYSDEFRERVTNDTLLQQLAELRLKGVDEGTAGLVIEAPDGADDFRSLLKINSFRHENLPKATSSQDVWYYLVLVGSCLFFFDVFVRRVQVSFAWAPVLATRVGDFVLRRHPVEAPNKTIERLRHRKAEVVGQMDQIRETARYETADETPVDLETPDQAAGGPPTGTSRDTGPPSISPEKETEQETYTSRLLKAKKKIWEERGKKE